MPINKTNRTEVGWGGHFFGASSCLFRRNTHLKYKDKELVVSTVGNYMQNGKAERLGFDHYFETMVFESDYNDIYHDANIKKQLNEERQIEQDDILANKMHERVVKKWMRKTKELE